MKRTIAVSSALIFAALAVAGATEESLPSIRGLSRSDLLQYHGKNGQIGRASTPKEWASRRAEALKAFQSIAGPLPGDEKRCALDVKIDEEVDCGSYVRRAISYASEPGSRTTAFLCIPKTALTGKPAHGVLCLHPTENNIGYKVVVGLGGKPHRQYASELAERGMVTIAPSYVQLAQYQPDLKALGYQSGTMKAIWDNIRAMDLLDALPFVIHGRYAAIGHSLGGHNAIYTAVNDDRIQVVVSSCGFDSFLDYYGGKINGWTQERYMPKLADYLEHAEDVPFDFYELVACLAPRKFFANAPLRDANFRWDSVDRILAAARPVYALHGAEANIKVTHPDSEHDFPDTERFAAYDWIQSGLVETK
ncbi:MAG: alpha/beta hydrolase [Verrucomicrobiales bacterium]|nr:alpha/beta hydrolase [Verrucomicrobiales bacterium]